MRIVSFLALIALPLALNAQEHGNRPRTPVFEPGGQGLALTGGDILLFDEKGAEAGLVNANRVGSIAVAFAPGGKLIASEGSDGRLYLFKRSKSEMPASAALKSTANNGRSRLSFSPDGKLVAVDHGDRIHFFKVPAKDGDEISPAGSLNLDPRNRNGKNSFAIFSKDWSQVLFAGQLVKLTLGKEVSGEGAEPLLNDSRITAQALSADGSKAVFLHNGGRDISVYEVATRKRLAARSLRSPVVDLCADAELKTVFTNDEAWNWYDDSSRALAAPKGRIPGDLELSPDGKTLADGPVLFDAATLALKKDLSLNRAIPADAWIDNKKLVVLHGSGSNGRFDQLTADFESGNISVPLRGRPHPRIIEGSLASSPDGSWGINSVGRIIDRRSRSLSAPALNLGYAQGLAAQCGNDGSLALVTPAALHFSPDIRKGREAPISIPIPAKGATRANVCLAPDARWAAATWTVGDATWLAVADLKTGKLIGETTAFSGTGSLAFAGDGRLLVAAGRKILSWKIGPLAANGKNPAVELAASRDTTADYPLESGEALSISAAGRELLVINRNGFIDLINLQRGNPVKRFWLDNGELKSR
ncbi:MAG: hypothetical protein RL095_4024 [Verrucomicrobiota bacterium]|jgi:WD40 repeat protein